MSSTIWVSGCILTIPVQRDDRVLIRANSVPGRWSDIRWPEANEIKDVAFIRVRIESASAKVREGGPGDAQKVRRPDDAVLYASVSRERMT